MPQPNQTVRKLHTIGRSLVLTTCLLLSCEKAQRPEEQKTIRTDSLAESLEDTTAYEESPESDYELHYVVAVAEGYRYDSLRTIALDVSRLLQFKFDTFDRYYDPKRGIILPDNYEDDIWAGQYYFRRETGDMVSIERTSAYIDTLLAKDESRSNAFYQDTARMFVFATMYPEKVKADSL